MQDWVELMDLISEDDIAWLLNAGNDRRIEAGAVLVTEGAMVDSLYFVIDGVLQVATAGNLERSLAVLGPGQIVGEMSFLDKQAASAMVRAQEDSRVLEIPRHHLSAKLHSDRNFAARFYRALAIILSGRLRRATSSTDRESEIRIRPQVSPSPAWVAIEPVLEQFKLAVTEAAGSAVQGEARVPEHLAREVKKHFHAIVTILNEELGEKFIEAHSVKKDVGRRVQQELLPYVLLARTPQRLYAKPRGYPGDYQTIEFICQNQAGGSGLLGELMDRLFLDETAAASLRNRRALAAEEIRGVISLARGRGEAARVTNLACGPATEVFDVYQSLEDKSSLETTLLDFDVQALAHLTQQIQRRELEGQVRLINGNVVYLALGREQLDLEPQDLVYALGLVDVFSDSICRRVLDYAHGILRPGGRILLFGFHPQNGNRAFMEHVLNWSCMHRADDDFNRLFANSAFKRPCTRLRFEDRGASLLAECVK